MFGEDENTEFVPDKQCTHTHTCLINHDNDSCEIKTTEGTSRKINSNKLIFHSYVFSYVLIKSRIAVKSCLLLHQNKSKVFKKRWIYYL